MITREEAIKKCVNLRTEAHHLGHETTVLWMSQVIEFLDSIQPQEAVEPGSISRIDSALRYGWITKDQADVLIQFNKNLTGIEGIGSWGHEHTSAYMEALCTLRKMPMFSNCECPIHLLVEPCPANTLTTPTDQPEWEETSPSEATHVKFAGGVLSGPLMQRRISRFGPVFNFDLASGWIINFTVDDLNFLGAKFLKQRKTLTAQIQEIMNGQADAGQVAAIEKLVGGGPL